MGKQAGAEAEVLEEATDGAENPSGQETDEAGLEQAGNEGADGGGEDSAAGAGGEEDEVGTGAEEEVGDGVETAEQKIARLEAEVAAIKNGGAKKEDQAPAKPLTDDEKSAIETRFGGMPFPQVDAISRMVANGLAQLEARLSGRLSVNDKSTIMSQMAKQKDFADIGSYSQAIDKYLSKFDSSLHGNKELIEDAYWMAKGRGLKNAVSRAVNSGERNRRIAGAARPAAPSAKGKGGESATKFKLTPAEESAYASFGRHKFKTKEEYARNLPRFKNQKK